MGWRFWFLLAALGLIPNAIGALAYLLSQSHWF
jgi:hypothetical protein